MVAKLLTPQQKETRMTIYADIFRNIKTDTLFLKNVLPCDESWFFTYDLETEGHSMPWKTIRQTEKGPTDEIKVKGILFFDIMSILHVGLNDRPSLPSLPKWVLLKKHS